MGRSIRAASVSTSNDLNHFFGMTMSTRSSSSYGGHTAEDGTAMSPTTSPATTTCGCTSTTCSWATSAASTMPPSHRDRLLAPARSSSTTTERQQRLRRRRAGLQRRRQQTLRRSSRPPGDTDAFTRRHLHRRHLPHARLLLPRARRHRLQHVAQVQPHEHPRVRHRQGRPGRAPASRASGSRCTRRMRTTTTTRTPRTPSTARQPKTARWSSPTRTPPAGEAIPIALEQLGLRSAYWVLVEDKVPNGYRGGSEIHLRFSTVKATARARACCS